MGTITSRSVLTGALAALVVGMSAAQAGSPLPPVHKSGTVEYLSGGIGRDEARAVEGESRHWPLTLEFAVKGKQRAEFAADVNVVVRDAKGNTALSVTADAPFLLARLAPGRYSIEASLAGKTLHEDAVVKAGQPARALFLWPADTGESSS
jgi:hypothetical protein